MQQRYRHTVCAAMIWEYSGEGDVVDVGGVNIAGDGRRVAEAVGRRRLGRQLGSASSSGPIILVHILWYCTLLLYNRCYNIYEYSIIQYTVESAVYSTETDMQQRLSEIYAKIFNQHVLIHCVLYESHLQYRVVSYYEPCNCILLFYSIIQYSIIEYCM